MLPLIVTSFLVFLSDPAFSQPSLKPTVPKNIQKLAKKYKLKYEDISFSLYDIEANKKLDFYNDLKPSPLASLSKILTADFSLSILGENESHKTRIYLGGSIEEGKLNGDLTIKGGGNPLFSSVDLLNFAFYAKSKGITEISGSIKYDETFMYHKHEISNLGQGDQTYNPGISALNVDFNRFTLLKSPSRGKTTKSVFTPIPKLDHIILKKTDSKFFDKKFFEYEFSPEEKEIWLLSKSKRYKRKEIVPVRNPGLFTAQLLEYYLNQVGIKTSNKVTKGALKGSESLFWVNESPPTKDIIRLTLEYSNNLLAESLLLKSSKLKTGSPQTLSQAAREMILFFKSQYPNVDWKKTTFINGSGLTSENRMDSEALTKLLSNLSKKSYGETFFPTYLSQSGRSGWIATRLNDENLSHKIWAKTGSLDYVNNIAGYLFSQSGKLLAFSILINDLPKREYIDSHSDWSSLKMTKNAPRWKSKTNQLIEELVSNWNIKY